MVGNRKPEFYQRVFNVLNVGFKVSFWASVDSGVTVSPTCRVRACFGSMYGWLYDVFAPLEFLTNSWPLIGPGGLQYGTPGARYAGRVIFTVDRSCPAIYFEDFFFCTPVKIVDSSNTEVAMSKYLCTHCDDKACQEFSLAYTCAYS